MRSASWKIRVLAGLTSVWLVAALATISQAQPAGAQCSPASACSEIYAAFAKLNTVSYRMRITGTSPQGNMTETEEWVPPGDYDIVASSSGAGQSTTMEAVAINKQYAYKIDMPGSQVPGNGQWKCGVDKSQMPLQPFSASSMNASSPDATVVTQESVSRGPDTSVGGTAVHTYYDTATVMDPTSHQTTTGKSIYYIATQTGLLRRVIMATPQGTVTMDYTDYGGVHIAMPPCK